jgi:hypothetical protein
MLVWELTEAVMEAVDVMGVKFESPQSMLPWDPQLECFDTFNPQIVRVLLHPRTSLMVGPSSMIRPDLEAERETADMCRGSWADRSG